MLSAGDKAPRFTLGDVFGLEHSFDEILSRGPVLLVLYKINCPVCQLTLPFLDRITNGALQMVAISQDDLAATKRFQAKFGGHMTTLLDRTEDGYLVSRAFGISHVPTLFLVEQDGTIAMLTEGFVKADLEAIAARAGVPIFRDDEAVPAWKAG
jgi:peroxiredoxin